MKLYVYESEEIEMEKLSVVAVCAGLLFVAGCVGANDVDDTDDAVASEEIGEASDALLYWGCPTGYHCAPMTIKSISSSGTSVTVQGYMGSGGCASPVQQFTMSSTVLGTYKAGSFVAITYSNSNVAVAMDVPLGYPACPINPGTVY